MRSHEWGSLNSDDGLWELLEGRFLNLDGGLEGHYERGSLMSREQSVLSAGSDWLLPAAAELTLGSFTGVICFLDESSMWEGVIRGVSCIEGNTERVSGKGLKQECTCNRDPVSEFRRITRVSLPRGFCLQNSPAHTHVHTHKQEKNKQAKILRLLLIIIFFHKIFIPRLW